MTTNDQIRNLAIMVKWLAEGDTARVSRERRAAIIATCNTILEEIPAPPPRHPGFGEAMPNYEGQTETVTSKSEQPEETGSSDGLFRRPWRIGGGNMF